MASRRVRWHPTIAVVLIVLLLLGAVPPLARPPRRPVAIPSS